MENDRQKEVINICLDHFIENGLYEVSTRSLSRALKLQNAGLYYYFASKDEAVIQCAAEAAIRVEDALIAPTIQDMADPDNMMRRLKARADKMAPTMRFLATVSGSKRYQEEMKPVIDGMGKRYAHFVDVVAKKLDCDSEEIEPYVYITISAVIGYMVFGEAAFTAPQIKIVKDEIKKLTGQARTVQGRNTHEV